MTTVAHFDNVHYFTQSSDSVSTLIEEYDDVSERKKKFIFPKFNVKSANVWLVTSSIIISSLIITIIILGINLKKCYNAVDNPKINNTYNSKNNVPINFTSAIILSDSQNLWLWHFPNHNFTILPNMKKVDAYNVHPDNMLFWIDTENFTINEFSNKYSQIAYPKKWKPMAIDIDFISEKFYLIDKASGSVNVIDMYGKYYRTIIANLTNPCDLALDSKLGLMFIVQHYNSIIRGNMDGTLIKTIIKSNQVSALTIDHGNQTIYWTNDFEDIVSSDYEGNNLKILTAISMKIESAAYFDKKLFWSTMNTVWFCKINNKVCDNGNVDMVSMRNSKVIKVFHNHPVIKNPCEHNNAGCQQLCLLSLNRSGYFPGHACACNDNWRLKADLHACEFVTHSNRSASQ